MRGTVGNVSRRTPVRCTQPCWRRSPGNCDPAVSSPRLAISENCGFRMQNWSGARDLNRGLTVPKSRRSRPPRPFSMVLSSFRGCLRRFEACFSHQDRLDHYMNYYTQCLPSRRVDAALRTVDLVEVLGTRIATSAIQTSTRKPTTSRLVRLRILEKRSQNVRPSLFH